MQRCLKCGRTYDNDTQKFCTHDGGRLAPDDQAARGQAPTAYDLPSGGLEHYDPEKTVQRMPDLNKTVMSTPTSEIRKDTGPTSTPPPPIQSAPTYQPLSQPPPSTPPTENPTIAFNPSQPFSQQLPPQQQSAQQPPQYYQPQAAPPPYVQPEPPTYQAPYAPAAPPMQQQPTHVAQTPPAATPRAGKKSRLPLIIAVVVILLAGAAAAWYFLIYKKGSASANSNASTANANSTTTTNENTSANNNATANDNSNTTANTNANTNTTSPSQPPPPNSTQFVNSKAHLDGKLAEKYSDFSFYYPNTWQFDPKSGVPGASNFVKVERRLPPDFTQENFAVSWYDSQGTLALDQENVFPKLIKNLEDRLAKSYPEFKVLSEGPATINNLNGYELRFQSVSRGTEKGDITLWGWVVFLPPGKEGESNGLQLLMLSTSLAPEIKSASDVGVKGELPIILNSFKVGS